MRITKNMLIDEALDLVKEYQKVNEEIFKMYQQDEIKWGEYYIFGLYENFHYKSIYGQIEGQKIMLYGPGKKTTKVWTYQYHIGKLKEDLEKARNFIEEKKATSLI